MDYYQKYQKYKFKYLNLLNQSGGSRKDDINKITSRLFVLSDHEYNKTEDVLEIFEKFIKEDGLLLGELNDIFKTIKMSELAVQQNGCALKYVDPKRFNNNNYVNICIKAVQQSGLALEYVKLDKKEDRMKPHDYFNICKLAVEQKSDALQFVIKKDLEPDILKVYKFEPKALREIILTAVKQNGLALKYIHENENYIYTHAELDMIEKLYDATYYSIICINAVFNNESALEFVEINKINTREYSAILKFCKLKNATEYLLQQLEKKKITDEKYLEFFKYADSHDRK